MKEIIIPIGLSKSGKSTFCKEMCTSSPDHIHISSDDIRDEMFSGSHHEKYNPKENGKVFEEMHRRLFKAIEAEDDLYIYYDATNISDRKRRHLLKLIKDKALDISEPIKVLFVILTTPYEALLDRAEEEGFPKYIILEQMKKFQFPSFHEAYEDIDLVTVDFEFINSAPKYPKNSIKYYYSKMKGFDQKTKWHDFDLYSHTKRCIDLTTNRENQNMLYRVAEWHDVGKLYARKIENDIARYYGHENISAYLYLTSSDIENDFHAYGRDFVRSIILIIQEHMHIKQIKTRKAFVNMVNRMGGLDNTSRLITFSTIDSLSAKKE